MPWRVPFIGGEDAPEKEHFRQGTREQYISDWVSIPADTKAVFIHNLGEIPPVIHVVYSLGEDGANPRKAVDGTDITVTYGDVDSSIESHTTTITVQNDLSEAAYFRLFAM